MDIRHHAGKVNDFRSSGAQAISKKILDKDSRYILLDSIKSLSLS